MNPHNPYVQAKMWETINDGGVVVHYTPDCVTFISRDLNKARRAADACEAMKAKKQSVFLDDPYEDEE